MQSQTARLNDSCRNCRANANLAEAMKNRTVLIALMLVAAGSDLVGCALHQVPIESPDVPPTMFEPLDVTVGVYFSPEFESFAHEQKGPRQPIWIHFKLGPPSRELFKQLFEATFRKTELVNSRVAMSDGGAANDPLRSSKL